MQCRGNEPTSGQNGGPAQNPGYAPGNAAGQTGQQYIPQQPPMPQTMWQPPVEPPKKKKTWLIFTIAAVLLIAGLTTILILLMQKPNDPRFFDPGRGSNANSAAGNAAAGNAQEENPDTEDQKTAEPISWGDAGLEAAMRDVTGIRDRAITYDDVAGITELDLSGREIHDIGALICLTNLQTLDITGTPVSEESIAALQKALPNLTIVGLEKTAATNAVKIGMIFVGDENEMYSYSHIIGIREALENTGLTDSSVVCRYSVPEDMSCYQACVDCAEQGCNLIITNSYGHQSYCEQAARQYPDVQFIAMYGDTAKASGLPNFHNAYSRIYEARYVSGIVAGMKINALLADGKLTDKNFKPDGSIRIGYVGAFTYAEVISGYTAFYLGIKSVCEKPVSMDVMYTSSWFDPVKESEAATALMNSGCVIIGQHGDAFGAPAACEEAFRNGTVVYSVSFGVDMRDVAPNTALTSATTLWGAYFTEIIQTMQSGGTLDTDWAEGFAKNAVAITELGASCAPGTAEAVASAIAGIKTGAIKVFDTETFTVDGQKVTHVFATDVDGDFEPDKDDAIFDGCYNESYFRSAPYFTLCIDGITVLNQAF